MSHLRRRVRPLLLVSFRWYILSCSIATFGAGMGYIAMTWMVIRAHTSVSAVAILMMCFWLPGVILGPFAGAIVDRFPRKYLVMLSQISRGIICILTGWLLLEHYNVTYLYIMAIVMGMFFTLSGPAMMKLSRELVAPKDMLYANSIIDMAYEIGNIVGMGSAGFLIALAGAPYAIIINGGLFLFAALMLSFVRKKHLRELPHEQEPRKTIWDDLKAGGQYLISKKILLVIYTVQLLVMVEFMTSPVLLAPFAKEVLHTSVSQFGDIEAAMSIGMVIGGLFMPWMAERIGFMRTMLVITFVLGISFVIFGYNRQISVAELLYFMIGFTGAVWPLILTKAQHLTELEYQGRVQSAFNSLTGVVIMLLYLCIQFTSHYITVQSLYWVEGAFAIIAVVLLWIYRDAI